MVLSTTTGTGVRRCGGLGDPRRFPRDLTQASKTEGGTTRWEVPDPFDPFETCGSDGKAGTHRGRPKHDGLVSPPSRIRSSVVPVGSTKRESPGLFISYLRRRVPVPSPWFGCTNSGMNLFLEPSDTHMYVHTQHLSVCVCLPGSGVGAIGVPIEHEADETCTPRVVDV